MPGKIVGENVQFRIEVEDSPKCVVLVLDRKCDWCIVPWEDAFTLAEAIERVIQDVKGEFLPSDQFTMEREQAQVKFNFDRGLVAILVEWTDRVKFTSLEALLLVARALRRTAQDAQLAARGVRLKYGRQGAIRELHDLKAGTVQKVR